MKTKIISMLLILMLILTNISFAVEILKDDLKKSATEVFPKEITISSDTGTTKFDIPGNVIVSDSMITIENDNLKSYIYYALEENKITYMSKHEMSIKVDENGEIAEEDARMELLAHAFLYTDYLYRAYLTVADALGIDYGLAVSYMHQISSTKEEIEEDTGSDYIAKTKTITDLYTYQTEYNLVEGYSELVYTLNLEEFAKIKESSITDGTIYTVSLSSVPTEDEVEDDDNTIVDENTNISNNGITNTNTSANTNTQTEMPKTGIKYETIYFLLGVIALCVIVGYKVYKAK